MTRRSWLFVPGGSESKLEKAAGAGADVVVIDLEDSVAPEAKDRARMLAQDWLIAHRLQVLNSRRLARWVRINGLDTPFWREDLSAVVAVSNPTLHGREVELYLRAPALFVTGDRDEYCDGALLSEQRTQLGDDVTVVIHPGVDHFWWGSDDRLIGTVSGFLREHL